MDIGPTLTAPTRDPTWKRKLLLMGLLGLVPVVGLLNLYGYGVQVYRARRDGATELPPVGFGYIVAGLKLCVPVLPVLCLLPSVYAFQWGFDLVLDAQPDPESLAHAIVHPLAVYHWHVFVGYKLLVALLALLFLFLGPAIAHQYLSKGDLLASLRFPTLLRTVSKHPGAYLLLWVMLAASGLIAGLGAVVFGVGVILTVPWVMVVMGVALADFDEAVS